MIDRRRALLTQTREKFFVDTEGLAYAMAEAVPSAASSIISNFERYGIVNINGQWRPAQVFSLDRNKTYIIKGFWGDTGSVNLAFYGDSIVDNGVRYSTERNITITDKTAKYFEHTFYGVDAIKIKWNTGSYSVNNFELREV